MLTSFWMFFEILHVEGTLGFEPKMRQSKCRVITVSLYPHVVLCAPGWIRTNDPLFNRQTL